MKLWSKEVEEFVRTTKGTPIEGTNLVWLEIPVSLWPVPKRNVVIENLVVDISREQT